jgi:hypothetical protein
MFFVAFAHSQDLLRHLNRRRSRLSRHDQQPPQLAASSMDGCVDDQDYNDGAQNDNPFGKLNARYRCLFAKPFHDHLPIVKQRLTKGEARRRMVRAEYFKLFLPAMATSASASASP